MTWCGLSPSELSMGRRIRTTVPQTSQQLTPLWPYLSEFATANQKSKQAQKKNFDRRHRVHEQPDISDGSEVWITTDPRPVEGRVVTHARAPRSYVVETPTGEVRRNRSQLNIVPDHIPELTDTTEADNYDHQEPPVESQRKIMPRSRTGTAIVPPNYL